jgi:hypothetical protein
MPQAYWQHPNSLAASKDPEIQRKIRKGRTPLFKDGNVIDKLALSYSDAKALGFEQVDDTSKTVGDIGWHAENDREFKERLIVSMFVESERYPLSRRELETVPLFLWGDRLPVVTRLWKIGDYDGMLWALLAEHPPWSTIASLMRPTKTGKAPNNGNVGTYLRSAAQKLGTTVPGLRSYAIKGLADARNREALRKARLGDRGVLRVLRSVG